MKNLTLALFLIMIMPYYGQASEGPGDWFRALFGKQVVAQQVAEEYIPHPQIEKDGYKDKFYIMCFKAKWCRACTSLDSKIEQWRKQGYRVYVFDYDKNLYTFRKLKVTKMPTVIMVKNQKESRIVGPKPDNVYSDKIRELNPVEPVEPDNTDAPVIDYNF